jgi:hypothetical protein
MSFKVMNTRCDQCLFGPDKIVSNARRSQILRDIRRKDCHFICHKTDDVCCRGYWDQNGGGQLGRIASRLGAVKFVEHVE